MFFSFFVLYKRRPAVYIEFRRERIYLFRINLRSILFYGTAYGVPYKLFFGTALINDRSPISHSLHIP